MDKYSIKLEDWMVGYLDEKKLVAELEVWFKALKIEERCEIYTRYQRERQAKELMCEADAIGEDAIVRAMKEKPPGHLKAPDWD